MCLAGDFVRGELRAREVGAAVRERLVHDLEVVDDSLLEDAGRVRVENGCNLVARVAVERARLRQHVSVKIRPQTRSQ